MLLATLIAPSVLLASSIDDNAGMFSKDAVAKANAKVAQMKRDYGRDVVVETFAEAKDAEKANADKGRYFSDWAKKRYEERKTQGILVLICKSPNYVYVQVGDKTRQMAIDDQRRDTIRDRFVNNFKEKKFDDGLLSAVGYIEDVFSARLKKTVASKQLEPITLSETQSSWLGWLCVAGAGLLALWVVVGLIRALSGGGAPASAGPGYAGGGGGGFVSSLFGGMLGAAAGMYLYNSFFGSGTSSVFGSGTNYDAGSGLSDNTSSGSGGSWDSSNDAGSTGSG
ncbi:MAG: TPM domain-containing protein, partial [Planctomycetia bacterium]|nr:TPM domain-containing protein [Planctomycetia bacterium]